MNVPSPNKPRNLLYFGSDNEEVREKKRDAAARGEPEAPPHKIFGIETRPLLAVAALLGIGYWAFTHDPIEAYKKKKYQAADEDDEVTQKVDDIYNDEDDDDPDFEDFDEDVDLIKNGPRNKLAKAAEPGYIRGVTAGAGGALRGFRPMMSGPPQEEVEYDDEADDDYEETGEEEDEPFLEYNNVG